MAEFSDFLINKMMSSLEPEDLQILNGSRSFNRHAETIEEDNKIRNQNTSCTDYYLMESSKKSLDTKSRKTPLRHKLENSKKKRYTHRPSARSTKWKTYNLGEKNHNHSEEVSPSDNSSGIVNNPMYQTNYMDLTETKKSIYKSLDKPRKKKSPKSSHSSKSSQTDKKYKYKSREGILSSWDLILKAADDPKDLKKILDKKLSPKCSKSKVKDLDLSKNGKNLDLSTSRPDEMVKSFFSYLNNYGDDGCTLNSGLNKTKEKTSLIKINSIFPLFRKSQPKPNLSDKNATLDNKANIEPRSRSENKTKIWLNCCGKKLSDSDLTIESKSSRIISDDDLDQLIERLGHNEEILQKLKNKLSLVIKSKKNQNFYFAVSPQHKTVVKSDNFLRGLCKHLNSTQLPASSTPNPDLLIQNFSTDSISRNNYFFKENQEQCMLSSIEQSTNSAKNMKKKYADGKIFEHEFGKILVKPNDQKSVMWANDKSNFKKAKQCTRNGNKIVQLNTRRTRVKSSKQILKEISEKCEKPATGAKMEKALPKNSFTNYCYYEDNLLRKDNLRPKTNKVKTKKLNAFLAHSENIYNDPAKGSSLKI
ncbi:hypothetical protein BpHYR1_039272 [Brachionus plicatilis]|uniref:Uncharacterized protein n=1 Tax=Brachionus plicatilis TaxID=10195 RepID=A0A3M7SS80_BRAPC|nr:hypothetical protein BpHYR1_039272 [Brachionus plicatilis]